MSEDHKEVEENTHDSKGNLECAEVKKVPVPSSIKAESKTWNSITLIWDEVDGAPLYQIEMDGSILPDMPPKSTFIKKGLLPKTEHSFRVRAVAKSSVVEWSGVEKGRTLKWECVWKECPDVEEDKKYHIEENPRIATKDNGESFCTIIGNTPIPLNAVTSWSIKVLKSVYNKGDNVYIGVAPNDIKQNDDCNCYKCGWYFNCYRSTLCSGPPQSYKDKEYGPHKGKGEGQYVHAGDYVGVVMDTTNGELSFVLNGVNRGVAHKGIPLDKPLVPCVLLKYKGSSVELNTPEIKI